MIHFLLRLRYLAVVAVLFAALNSVALLVIAIYKAFHAYQGILAGAPWDPAKGPGILIVESIDTFLVALVLLVLAFGVAELFLISDEEKDALPIPSWMRVKSFLELKLLLWEAVLTVLVVTFVGHVAAQGDMLNWTVLILPASILMLAVSLYIMKKISGVKQ